jgi:predicted ATPase with chaperone activity
MGRQGVFCSHFVLIGSMNPCPCGYYGDPVKECTCMGLGSRVVAELIDERGEVERLNLAIVPDDNADFQTGHPGRDPESHRQR